MRSFIRFDLLSFSLSALNVAPLFFRRRSFSSLLFGDLGLMGIMGNHYDLSRTSQWYFCPVGLCSTDHKNTIASLSASTKRGKRPARSCHLKNVPSPTRRPAPWQSFPHHRLQIHGGREWSCDARHLSYCCCTQSQLRGTRCIQSCQFYQAIGIIPWLPL